MTVSYDRNRRLTVDEKLMSLVASVQRELNLLQETTEEIIVKDTVTGIKGDEESSYRTGNVNLTADNIGASPSPVFSGTDNSEGCVVIGDFAVAWGVASITSGTTGTPSGGVTTYAGSETVDWNTLYGLTFKQIPCVMLTWAGNYANQVSLSTYSTSTTSSTVYGRLLTSESTRSVRWIAIGQLA